MKTILFVDDDRSLLDGLRRLLHPLRNEWEMTFVPGAAEALEVLTHAPCDVIISDIRMPTIDGIELLSRVRDLYPQTVRIVFSGQAERELTLKSATAAHQYLSKPLDSDALVSTIARATALKISFDDPSLRSLVSGIRSLPSVPSIYRELLGALDLPESGVDDVARIIAKDTAMTAKVLQLANSAFFGLPRHLTSPKDAVLYLGIETIKALALSVNVFSQFHSSSRLFSIGELAYQSTLTGMLARKIAMEEGASRAVREDSLMAGLLHRVGVLILASAFPQKYDEALELANRSGTPVWRAEQEIFGTTHAELGSYLLWLWGMSDSVVEAVAYRTSPSRCPVAALGALTFTHIASMFEETRASQPGGMKPGTVPDSLDVGYLARLSLLEHVPDWGTWANDTIMIKEAA
jgi:HD-like signal output (HDOD) protein